MKHLTREELIEIVKNYGNSISTDEELEEMFDYELYYELYLALGIQSLDFITCADWEHIEELGLDEDEADAWFTAEITSYLDEEDWRYMIINYWNHKKVVEQRLHLGMCDFYLFAQKDLTTIHNCFI